MNIKIRNMTGILLNAALIVLEIIGCVLSVSKNGWNTFQFYTEDSNYLLLLSSLIIFVYQMTHLLSKKPMPGWMLFIRYAAICCVSLTFLVVLFVLGPMAEATTPGGYVAFLFSDSMLYHHFLCPIIALLSFFLCENVHTLSKKELLFASIPTLVYATTIIILNLSRTITGPYPFLRVYEQPWYMSIIWVIAILGGAFLIQWGIWALHNLFVHHHH